MTRTGMGADGAGNRSGQRRSARLLRVREQEVLRLIAIGSTDGEIARALVVSHHTVANHVRHIRAKLDVATRAAAVAVVIRAELL